MTHAAELPAWAAVTTSLLLLLGSGLALTGSLGLLRFKTFYQRVHAPTLGTTLGIASVLAASMLFFSVLQTRLVVHEVLIAASMFVTTPVTLVLLARAALYRDRSEGNEHVPPPLHRRPATGSARHEKLDDPRRDGRRTHTRR